MSVIYRILHARLSVDPMDAWLSRWGCTVGGLALPGLGLAILRTHAASRQEFVLGAAAAGVAGLLLFLLGGLSQQVHLAARAGRAPWRARRGEVLSHVAGLATLGLGGCATVDAASGVAGVVTGAFLVFGAYVAVLCLGCWTTVARCVEQTAPAEPKASPDPAGIKPY